MAEKPFGRRFQNTAIEKEVKHGIWGPIAKFVVNKPGISGGIVGIFLVITAFNVFNLDYEFDTVKKFPKDLPSRVGYEIVETRYDKGELAPTTLLIESDQAIDIDELTAFTEKLQNDDEISAVRLTAQSEDAKAMKLSVALALNPYSTEAIDMMDDLREDTPNLLKDVSIPGEAYFSGVTTKLVDERDVNTKDIFKIVILETLLILILLFALTRSIKMPFI